MTLGRLLISVFHKHAPHLWKTDIRKSIKEYSVLVYHETGENFIPYRPIVGYVFLEFTHRSHPAQRMVLRGRILHFAAAT